MTWRPLTRPPRRGPLVECTSCFTVAVNEDANLRGWEETAVAPMRYRCPACARAMTTDHDVPPRRYR